jgi:uncharacterized membrane protein YdfJ with MMPL/SSD domain
MAARQESPNADERDKQTENPYEAPQENSTDHKMTLWAWCRRYVPIPWATVAIVVAVLVLSLLQWLNS